jgi:hypothetical protein
MYQYPSGWIESIQDLVAALHPRRLMASQGVISAFAAYLFSRAHARSIADRHKSVIQDADE